MEERKKSLKIPNRIMEAFSGVSDDAFFVKSLIAFHQDFLVIMFLEGISGRNIRRNYVYIQGKERFVPIHTRGRFLL